MAPAASVYSWEVDHGDTPTEVVAGITVDQIVLSQNSWSYNMAEYGDRYGVYDARSRLHQA